MYPINIVASFIHQKSWEQGYNLVLISAMGFLMDFRPEMRRAGGVRKTGVFLVLSARADSRDCRSYLSNQLPQLLGRLLAAIGSNKTDQLLDACITLHQLFESRDGLPQGAWLGLSTAPWRLRGVRGGTDR
jgi:hypothetical protein